MKRPAALAAVAALFVLGALVGALTTHLLYARQLAPPWAPPFVGPPLFAEMLHRRLDLSPEQAREVEAILRQSHDEAEAVRRELLPEVRTVMKRAHARIEEVLTPEQRERFRELLLRRQHRLDRFLHGAGGRHHHRRHPEPPP